MRWLRWCLLAITIPIATSPAGPRRPPGRRCRLGNRAEDYWVDCLGWTLAKGLHELRHVGNVFLAERRGKQLRHGRLRIFDEGHRLGHALLRRLTLERRPDA